MDTCALEQPADLDAYDEIKQYEDLFDEHRQDGEPFTCYVIAQESSDTTSSAILEQAPVV